MYQSWFGCVLTVVPFHKSGHKCFARSGFLLEIRLKLITLLLSIVLIECTGHCCHVNVVLIFNVLFT